MDEQSEEYNGELRVKALEMQARGATVAEIAFTLNVPMAQIEPIVREANTSRVPKSPEERYNEAGRHIAILERVTSEMLRAWEHSKEDVEVVTETVYEGEDGSGNEVEIRRKTETKRSPSVGNPQFIKELRATLKDIRRIAAIDAPPQQTQGTDNHGSPRNISINIIKPPEPTETDEDETEDNEDEDETED